MQPTDEEIKARLQAILGSGEFQPSLSARARIWLDDAIRVLVHALENMSPAVRWLAIVVCLVVLLAISVRLWRSYQEAAGPLRRRPAIGNAREQTPVSPADLLARARSLADGGSLRDAALALQHALLFQTCLERKIAWQSSRSDWEWLRILTPSIRVIDFTQAAQRLAFGPEPTRDAFDACAKEADALLAYRGKAGREAP
jgi:hypothetical protein